MRPMYVLNCFQIHGNTVLKTVSPLIAKIMSSVMQVTPKPFTSVFIHNSPILCTYVYHSHLRDEKTTAPLSGFPKVIQIGRGTQDWNLDPGPPEPVYLCESVNSIIW